MALDFGMGMPNIAQSIAQGVQLGMMPEQIQAQQMEMQANQAAQAQAIERQRQLKQGMAALARNPNPSMKDYQTIIPLLPKDQGELMLKTWEAKDKAQQQGMLSLSGQVMSALRVNPELGIKILQEQEDAAKTGGDQQRAQALATWRRIAEIRPQESAASIGLLVSQLPGGKELIEGMTKLGAERRAEELQPSELSKSQSEAQKASVAAKFAESNAVIDLQKKNWDITKLQNDIQIAKQNAAIAAAGVAASREGNQLRRQELGLKVQEMIDKRDATVREKVSGLESARSSIDNMINTADRVLSTPMGVIGSAAGPISSRMPTLSQSTADFEALIETLGAQSFISQIPNIQGMGALSNAEGEKLQSALQSFSLKQSPEQLTQNVREAQRLMLKARTNLSKKFGLPDSVPDTPAASASPADIDALVKKYGGK